MVRARIEAQRTRPALASDNQSPVRLPIVESDRAFYFEHSYAGIGQRVLQCFELGLTQREVFGAACKVNCTQDLFLIRLESKHSNACRELIHVKRGENVGHGSVEGL